MPNRKTFYVLVSTNYHENMKKNDTSIMSFPKKAYFCSIILHKKRLCQQAILQQKTETQLLTN